MFQRLLKDFSLFVAFLYEVKKAHPSSVKEKYPGTQSPASENRSMYLKWRPWNGS